ncbi:hypothetical protein KDA_58780 [Dictyobacter alpinus]|uniref:Uncharacterized protein n=1 Tax=Dictyobacter alpinus TaxID=2014873 RepID=A0A402BG76_9CHLR|nr:hypothetical protein KDA_58780 [Dictyobacter alpinus]
MIILDYLMNSETNSKVLVRSPGMFRTFHKMRNETLFDKRYLKIYIEKFTGTDSWI